MCDCSAQQLLLVKIQKLVYRGGKEENEAQHNSRVRIILEIYAVPFYVSNLNIVKNIYFLYFYAIHFAASARDTMLWTRTV